MKPPIMVIFQNILMDKVNFFSIRILQEINQIFCLLFLFVDSRAAC
jgi:hypothetical protein